MIKIDSTIPFEELPFHLNLKSDDTVFVSSDLKNFALHAKNNKLTLDINAFIVNFQKVLSEGTIIIPGYTDNLKNNDTFDYEKSKPTTGAISNRVYKRKDFFRTTDPLHSVFVWGKSKETILSLKDVSTFGKNTIFGYMHNINGIFLFMDVDIENSFTFIHYIEEYLKVPYRKYYTLNLTIKKDGIEKLIKLLFHTKKPGVVTDFKDLNNTFIETNLMTQFIYNTCVLKKISAQQTIQIVEQKITHKKYLYHFSLKEFIIRYIKKMLKK
jgi:aminoglycoside 3-N-acetyltransferase